MKYLEWIIAYLGTGMLLLTLPLVMFTDDPSFVNNLNQIQKIAFNYQGLFILLAIVIFITSVMGQFSSKPEKWRHISSAAGFFEIVITLIIFSAY